MEDITIVPALGLSLLGILVVFFMLILLMVVIGILSKVLSATQKTETAAASPVSAAAPTLPEAPGSCGDIKLYNVSERQAAMIMAIVADELGVPLNTLRFRSIKERV